MHILQILQQKSVWNSIQASSHLLQFKKFRYDQIIKSNFINQFLQINRTNVFSQTRQRKACLQYDYKITQDNLSSSSENAQGFKNTSESEEFRGKHELEFTTKPFEKGQIKCNKQVYSIPMTLFYDEEENKFLEKQLDIEGEVLNQLDQRQKSLGSAIINISPFISVNSKEKLELDVSLLDDDEQKSSIRFHVSFEKEQKEDNKSDDNNKSQSYKQLSENGDGKSQVPKGFTNNYKVKEVISSERSSEKNSMASIQLNKKINPSRRNSRQKLIQQNSNSFTPTKQVKQVKEKKLIQQKFQQFDLRAYQSTDYKQPSQSQRLHEKQRKNEFSRPPKPPKTLQNYKSNERQNQLIPVSLELELFEAQKKLKQKDKIISAAKKDIQNQKKLIQKLLDEQNRQLKSSEVIKYSKEIESLKSQLLKANLKISELQTSNRQYQATQKDHMKIIQSKSQQAFYYKSLLQKEKLKIGNIMQRCLQTNDIDFITLIEQEIEKG